MNEEYLRFRLFPDKQTAEDFAEVLEQSSDGYKVYSYNERVRNYGRIIVLISIAIPVLTVILRIVGL